MEYFAPADGGDAVIAVLTVVLYRRRRDMGLMVGALALYYWSLFGAWSIVIDKTGGFSGKHYYYLENKLFPIALDSDYMLALGLYAGFIIVAQLTLLRGAARGRRERPIPRLILRHEPILIVGVPGRRRQLFHHPRQTRRRLGAEHLGISGTRALRPTNGSRCTRC